MCSPIATSCWIEACLSCNCSAHLPKTTKQWIYAVSLTLQDAVSGAWYRFMVLPCTDCCMLLHTVLYTAGATPAPTCCTFQFTHTEEGALLVTASLIATQSVLHAALLTDYAKDSCSHALGCTASTPRYRWTPCEWR